MRITLAHIDYTIKGQGTKAKLVPFYLNYEDEEKINEIIKFLENNIGKKKFEIDNEIIEPLFHKENIVKGVLSSASRFYSFESYDLSELEKIDEEKSKEKIKEPQNKESTTEPINAREEKDNVKLSSLDSFLKQKKDADTDTVKGSSSIKERRIKIKRITTAAELREKVFDYISEHYPYGYVNSDQRSSAIEDIEETFNVPRGKLLSLLYSDRENEKILIKKIRELSDTDIARKIIEYYNYDVIETVLSYATMIKVTLDDFPGYIAKNLIYVSKANYVWTDIRKEKQTNSKDNSKGTRENNSNKVNERKDAHFVITIEPPLELYQEATKWGKNLSAVALFVMRKAIENNLNFSIEAIVQPRKRKVLFSYNNKSQDNVPLPLFRLEEEEKKKKVAKEKNEEGISIYLFSEFEEKKELEIDSEIEKSFINSWGKGKGRNGWLATAEPETIFLKNSLFIPDFVLKRGSKKVYMEIVGFYTLKYIQKKKKKMEEMKKLSIPIIYLIDQELADHFKDMREIDIIYYKKDVIPHNKLLKLLNEKYSDYEERIEHLKVSLEKLCQELDKEQGISSNKIVEKIGAYSENELKKLLNDEEIKNVIKSNNAKIVEGYGLVNSSVYNKIKRELLKRQKMSVVELKRLFPKLAEGLLSICKSMGCMIKWKSINEIEIELPHTLDPDDNN